VIALKYRTVLFDLDGTLLDTNDLILASFMYTLEHHCPGRYTKKDVLACMGEPLYEQMKRFGGEEQAEAMVKTYREHNIAHHDDYVQAFPGVIETVRRLKEEGVTMGIVSNKQRVTVEMGLDLTGLTPFMSTVVCFGDTPAPKPDPAPVKLALDQLQAEPDSALMVGDSKFDILAAQAAGVDSAAVAWSLHAGDSLRALSPDYILDTMEDLLTVLDVGRQREGDSDEKNRTVSR
jgi:pyrophosphatase PpaX